MFSLWAESDKKYGGLSLSSQDVGQVLSITGNTYYLGTFISVASVVLCVLVLFYHNLRCKEITGIAHILPEVYFKTMLL